MHGLRQIAVEPVAQEQLDAIYGGSEIADEVTTAFFGILSRAPERGTKISAHVWKMEMQPFGIIKGVTAYYTFDETEVGVLSFLLTGS